MYEGIRDVDLAWTAGILDADGCLAVNGGRHSYCSCITVAGRYAAIPKRLYKLYGGYFHTYNLDTYWNLYKSEEIGELLKIIMPYLVAKREQAECCIKLGESITKWKGKKGKKRGNPLPNEVWEYRRQLYERCKVLKGIK